MTRKADDLIVQAARLRAIVFHGTQPGDHTSYRLALFTDAGQTKTSFTIAPGESIADGLKRVDERYKQESHKTAVLTDSNVRPRPDEDGR